MRRLPLAEAARRLRARAVRAELALALDDWAALKVGAEARSLRDLAKALGVGIVTVQQVARVLTIWLQRVK